MGHTIVGLYGEDLIGWVPATGRPLPHTLQALGLEKLIPDLERSSDEERPWFSLSQRASNPGG
jgi:hypothetical protein